MKLKVWCPDMGMAPEDAETFVDPSAEMAATEWADWEDYLSNEYSIVGGKTVKVCVQEEGSDTVQEFIVSGRMDRCYYARPVMDHG